MDSRTYEGLFIGLLICTIIFICLYIHYLRKDGAKKSAYFALGLSILFGSLTVLDMTHGIMNTSTSEQPIASDISEASNESSSSVNISEDVVPLAENAAPTKTGETSVEPPSEPNEVPYGNKDLKVKFTGPDLSSGMEVMGDAGQIYYVNADSSLNAYESNSIRGEAFHFFFDPSINLDSEMISNMKCNTSLTMSNGTACAHDIYVEIDSFGMTGQISLVPKDAPVEGESYKVSVELLINDVLYSVNELPIVYHSYSSIDSLG